MKTQLILTLYTQLATGNKVSRLEFCQAHRITERTFYRYANEITIFLRNHKPNLVLDVIDPQGLYYLAKVDEIKVNK